MREVGGSRGRGAFCLDYFSFFFSFNKHVKTRVLTCIDIRLIYLALKTWFKRREYLKVSSFNQQNQKNFNFHQMPYQV